MASRLRRAAALGAGLGVLAALGRRAAPRVRARRRRDAGASAPGASTWRCDCGQAYRVSGLDRHRVYWLEGAAEGDPVLGEDCPRCGRPLPAGSVPHLRPVAPS